MAQTLGDLAEQVAMEIRESFSSPGTAPYVTAFEELVHIMLYAPYEQSRHARLAELMTTLHAAPESFLEVANRFLKLGIIAVELDGSIAIATGVATKYSKFIFTGQVVPQDAVQGLNVTIRIPYGTISISNDSLTVTTLAEWVDLDGVIRAAQEEATVLLAAQAVFSAEPLSVTLDFWREEPQDGRAISEGIIEIKRRRPSSINVDNFIRGSEIIPLMIQERLTGTSDSRLSSCNHVSNRRYTDFCLPSNRVN